MQKEKLLQEFKVYEDKTAAFSLALATLSFDADTGAPEDGAMYRNKMMSILSGEAFTYQTDEENINMLVELSSIEDLPFETKRNIQYRLRDLNNIRYVPKDVYIAYNQLVRDAQTVWEKAKADNDYQSFKPYLVKLVEETKKMIAYRPSKENPYNQLLDDYEYGMTMEDYDQFFGLVKEKLIPLIHKIKNATPVEDSFLHSDYDTEKQKIFMQDILDYIGYSDKNGMLKESVHPFTMGIAVDDVRITTRYIEDMVASGILSTVHELGHAVFYQQIDSKYNGTAIFHSMTSGMHESQSRLFENYLGRTVPFWKNNYPKLQSLFPENLGNVSLEKFVDAINASYPSYIRTEADELTYPLHILIRYEIEKGLFNNEINPDELDKIWNDKYEEYLGIRPRNDSEGILQDVHWSGAMFGCFPTYALGSAYSAQWMKALQKDVDISACLENNDFFKIRDWLKENLHKDGGLYTPEELLLEVTGEKFNPNYYIDYLTEKYTKLYKL